MKGMILNLEYVWVEKDKDIKNIENENRAIT